MTLTVDGITAENDEGEETVTNSSTTISSTTDTLIFDTSSVNVENIVIPSTTLDTKIITLDMGALQVGSTVTLGTKNITLERQGTTDYTAIIPAGTVITGMSGWDGKLILPTVSSITSDEGTVNTAVEMGSSAGSLTFDKAVKIIIEGMAGKSALYQLPNGTQYTITGCTDATDSSAGSLAIGSECYTDAANRNDLIIWTYHFTIFAAYTPTSGDGTTHSHYHSTSAGGGSYSEDISASTPTELSSVNNINLNNKPTGGIGITGGVIGALTSPLSLLAIGTTLVLVLILIVLSKKKKLAEEERKKKIQHQLRDVEKDVKDVALKVEEKNLTENKPKKKSKKKKK